MIVSVSAEISMVKPIQKSFSENDTIDVGEAVKGESIDFIFNSAQSSGLTLNSIEVLNLPIGWKITHSEFFGDTVGIIVKIPSDEELGNKIFKLKLFDSSSPQQSQTFNVNVFIKSNLVRAQVTPSKQETIVGEKVFYDITLFNDSISDHFVFVGSDLPGFWFNEKYVKVRAKSLEKLRLDVTPRTYGVRNFNFIIKSALNDSIISSFPGEITVNPTIESKFASGFFGIPFYSLTLQPYYLVNAFISMLLR
ncbi:MAG: hypothetical protein Q7S21_07975 [archaeon]|nr:hypothetical protein [archaeon]